MTKEELMAMGISEAQSEKIVQMYNEVINERFIPRSRFNEVNEENRSLKAAISHRDKQLEELKSSDADVDALKQQITELQEQNKQARKQHEADMEKLKMEGIIESTLAAAGAKNIKAVRALLDESRFKLKGDDTVIGLKEGIAAVKKSDPYLFETNEQRYEPKGMTGFKPETDSRRSGAGGGSAPVTYAQWCERFGDYSR